MKEGFHIVRLANLLKEDHESSAIMSPPLLQLFLLGSFVTGVKLMLYYACASPLIYVDEYTYSYFVNNMLLRFSMCDYLSKFKAFVVCSAVKGREQSLQKS